MSQLSKVISLVYCVHFSAVLRYLQGFEMCVAGVQPERTGVDMKSGVFQVLRVTEPWTDSDFRNGFNVSFYSTEIQCNHVRYILGKSNKHILIQEYVNAVHFIPVLKSVSFPLYLL